MSIFQNKLFLVHITCEIVTIGAIVYMLNKKNKFLLNEINRLENVISEQNKLLKQHTILINQLFEMLKTKDTSLMVESNVNVKPKTSESNKDIKESVSNTTINKIQSNLPVTNKQELDFETESQLDRNIEKELDELNDVE
jgi:hypothetical protein